MVYIYYGCYKKWEGMKMNEEEGKRKKEQRKERKENERKEKETGNEQREMNKLEIGFNTLYLFL